MRELCRYGWWRRLLASMRPKREAPRMLPEAASVRSACPCFNEAGAQRASDAPDIGF
jgi:hypothetical protein